MSVQHSNAQKSH